MPSGERGRGLAFGMLPDDANALDVRQRLHALQRLTTWLSGLFDRHGIEEDTKDAMLRETEAHFGGEVLDAGERRLRGIQGRN